MTSNVTYTAIAGAPLGGHRIVIIDSVSAKAIYADKDDLIGVVDRLLGMTIGAANPGAAVSVVSFGIIQEPTWSWDLSKCLFLGNNGLITQDAPTSGVCLPLGFPMASDKVLFSPKQPVILA